MIGDGHHSSVYMKRNHTVLRQEGFLEVLTIDIQDSEAQGVIDLRVLKDIDLQA